MADDSQYAYMPPSRPTTYSPVVMAPIVKIIPRVPASQSDRPQLRPVSND